MDADPTSTAGGEGSPREAGDDRLMAIEIRLAHQDRIIAELDQVIREFALRVERLEQRTKELGQVASGEAPIGPADDPPPHY